MSFVNKDMMMCVLHKCVWVYSAPAAELLYLINAAQRSITCGTISRIKYDRVKSEEKRRVVYRTGV